jgi:hypothetical protein
LAISMSVDESWAWEADAAVIQNRSGRRGHEVLRDQMCERERRTK